MTKSHRSRLLAVALLVAVANVCDLASTYLASPDLSGEWNVLQSKFGLGWAGLIFAKVIGGALAVAGYAYYLRFREACYPYPGMDRRAFCRHFTFGRQANWLQMSAGIPIGPYLGVNLGYFWAGMQLMVLWVAVDNVLLHFGLYLPVRHVSEYGYHLAQSVIVAAIVLARFYRTNYARYRSLTDTAVVVAPAQQTAAVPAP